MLSRSHNYIGKVWITALTDAEITALQPSSTHFLPNTQYTQKRITYSSQKFPKILPTILSPFSYLTVPEITVGHQPFPKENHILIDYLEACSNKHPTSNCKFLFVTIG